MTGVSIPCEECRKSGGVTSSAPSSLNDEYWKNNVITEAYCSSSRVTVAIIPQTGERSSSFMTVCFTRGNMSLFQASWSIQRRGITAHVNRPVRTRW